MRSTLIVSAFAALTLAAPRPQELDFTDVDAAPDAPIYVPAPDVKVPIQPISEVVSIAKASIDEVATAEKRDLSAVIDTLSKRAQGDCHALPAGTGPSVHTPDDTPASFKAYQPFHDDAQDAAKPQNIPAGYALSFSDVYASSQTTNGLGTSYFTTYDVAKCAQLCTAKAGCSAFNIYYERDPSQSAGPGCMNPESNTNIVCVRYGVNLSPETATNTGQKRADFTVVISGSNGYNRNQAPPTVAGFTAPIPLAGTINAPNDPVTNTNTYITQKFFSFDTVSTFDNGAVACVQACKTQTAYNAAHPPKNGANPSVCNQVVVFVLNDDDQPQGVYCALYTEEWSSAYATNFGQYRSNGHYWSNTQVFSYTNQVYSDSYEPICAKAGCPAGSYQGGNNGGYGPQVKRRE